MIEHILAYHEYQAYLDDLDQQRWDDDGGSVVERVIFATPLVVGWRPVEQNLSDVRYASMADYMDSLKECVNPENRKIHQSWYDGQCFSPYRTQPLSVYLGGFNSARGVRKLYDTGWSEGLERARRLIEDFKVDAVPHDHRRRMKWGEFGDHLDISRVYSGHHNMAWQSARRKYTMAPQRVTIVANLICPWHAPVDTLFWRGAAAIVLSDLLEAAGYMTKIDIGEGGRLNRICFKDKNKQIFPMSHRITVKDFGETIDMATITASIHGGFVRAMNQAWTAGHAPMALSYLHYEIGTCVMDEGDILASHEIFDEPSAKQWIREQLEKINQGEGE